MEGKRVGGRFDPDSPACEYFEENEDELVKAKVS